MKTMTLFFLLFAAAVVRAEPQVSNLSVQQRYPWQRAVDIGYTIAGMTGDAGQYEMSFLFSYDDGGVTNMIVPRTFETYVASDLPVTNGTFHVVWDAVADGLSENVKDLSATASLVFTPVSPGAAEFMIVDLSKGTSGPYSVRYVASNLVTSAEFAARDRYKTTHLVLKRIPPQTCWIGEGTKATANYGDGEIASAESNRRLVRFTKGYYLGIFEFTQAQYVRVKGALTSDNPDISFSLGAEAPLRPVGYVTWNTVMAANGVLTNINARLEAGGFVGSKMTLPTEFQWECACRAGTLTRFWWGSDVTAATLSGHAWWSANSKIALYNGHADWPVTHAVAQFEANPWGFYDMYGNVDEWCLDWRKSYPENALDGTGNPIPIDDYCATEQGDSTLKVTRGAAYRDNTAVTFGSGTRFPYLKTEPNQAFGPTGDYVREYGFRLAWQLDGSESTAETEPATVSSAACAVAGFDFSAAPLAPASLSRLYPFAWNSTLDWRPGGDGAVAVTVRMTALSGNPADDPSGWQPTDDPVTLVNASGAGAGTVVWTPEKRGLYRAELLFGSVVTNTVYFNLLDTEGFSPARPITDCTLVVNESQVAYTGDGVVPQITLTLGDKTLVENVDYIFSAVDNIYPGTATYTIAGIVDYTGTLTGTFEVTEPTETEQAVSEALGGPNCPAQPDFADFWFFRRSDEVPQRIAANSGESFPHTGVSLWPTGGLGDGTVSRISIAAIASEDAEPGEYAVLGETTAEETLCWRAKMGWWSIKLETVKDAAVVGMMTRRVFVQRDAGGLKIILR